MSDSTHDLSSTDLPPAGTSRPSSRRSRRKVAVLATAALLLGLAITAVAATTGGSDAREGSAAAEPANHLEVSDPTNPTPPSAAAAVVPVASDSGTPVPSGPQPTSPPAAPGHLVVSTGHLNLGQNVFSGSFEVHNDGGSPIEWAWTGGHPAISADPQAGVLAPGDSAVVTVTVHWQQLGNGGYLFQTKVTADGQQLNVVVSGSKLVVVNPGIDLPNPQIKP
jgi:hypothetical protein